MQGRFLGVAKVMQAVRADATPEDLAAQLGLRKKVLAEEARRAAPIARRRLAAANARAAANVAAFGLDDPDGSGDAGEFGQESDGGYGDGFSLEDLASV